MSTLRTLKPVKALVAGASAVLLAVTASACAGSSAAPTNDDGKAVVKYQGYPSQLLPPEIAVELGYLEDVELEWLGNVNGGPESIQGVATKSTDFGGAFNGAIVKLRDSGANVTAVLSYYGSNEKTNSTLLVLEDSPIQNARDLIGKSVGVNTLGAQSELTIRDWLEKEGLSAEEVAQVELKVVPPANAEQVLRQGQIDSILIGTIALDIAQERGGVRGIFSDAELFGNSSNGTLIFRDEYIEANPELVKKIVEASARAIRWTQTSDPEEVRAVLTTALERRDGKDGASNVKHWQSLGVATPGGVIRDEEFSRWLEWLKAHGEIKNQDLTISEVFTNDYNPYANGTFDPNADHNGN